MNTSDLNCERMAQLIYELKLFEIHDERSKDRFLPVQRYFVRKLMLLFPF